MDFISSIIINISEICPFLKPASYREAIYLLLVRTKPVPSLERGSMEGAERQLSSGPRGAPSSEELPFSETEGKFTHPFHAYSKGQK